MTDITTVKQRFGIIGTCLLYTSLHDLSLQAPGREEEELCRNFDRAFLNLYPNFVEKFNALLNPCLLYTSRCV